MGWFDKLTMNGIEGLTMSGKKRPPVIPAEVGIQGEMWGGVSFAKPWMSGLGALHRPGLGVQRHHPHVEAQVGGGHRQPGLGLHVADSHPP